MSLPEPERIFDGQHLRATLWPGTRDRLFVTFDYRRNGRAGFGPANLSTGFARQGYGQLVINSAANDWFLNAETPALEAALATLAGRHARVQALGFSMGGYGALRFARALRLDQAVVVSPQVSLSPAVAPWETRYPAEAREFDEGLGDLTSRAVPDLTGLVVFDPFRPADLAHARAIAALFPRLRLVRLAFGGHPAIRSLRAGGKLGAVQREAMVERPSAARLIAAHRGVRHLSLGYCERFARQAARHHPAWAARALAQAAGLRDAPGDRDERDGEAPAVGA